MRKVFFGLLALSSAAYTTLAQFGMLPCALKKAQTPANLFCFLSAEEYKVTSLPGIDLDTLNFTQYAG